MTDDVQLTITAPPSLERAVVYSAKARSTLGVLIQLIAEAKKGLVLAAPFARSSALVENVSLRHALTSALERGVRIDLAVTASELSRLDLSPLISVSRERLRVFYPSANAGGHLGSHAKFYIADQRKAYIGSANLSYLGLQEHLEMGVLVEGPIASRAFGLWVHLCDTGFFEEASP